VPSCYAGAMRLSVILLVVLACLCVASPALGVVAPRVTATYGVTEGASAATWSVNSALGGDSDGSVPSLLTSAARPDDVQPCDPITGGMGTITERVAGVASSAAGLRFAILLDVRRGTGRVTLYPQVQRSGEVSFQRITDCAPPADMENGTIASTFDASMLFTNLLPKPRPWTVRRGLDGSWRTGSAQQAPFGQIHRANIRLTGSPAAMNAGCRIPTVYEMRNVRSLTGAVAFIARDGFTRPNVQERRSTVAPRGRYYILQRSETSHTLCGARTVTIVKSLGR